MTYFLLKAGLTGLLAASISEIARRHAGWGGLLASLPLTSLMAMIWLYRDTGSSARVADLSWGISLFFLPSIPLFIALPLLLRAGVQFWIALALVTAMTLALYAATFWVSPRLGVRM